MLGWSERLIRGAFSSSFKRPGSRAMTSSNSLTPVSGTSESAPHPGHESYIRPSSSGSCDGISAGHNRRARHALASRIRL
jgi:hypothetical protein